MSRFASWFAVGVLACWLGGVTAAQSSEDAERCASEFGHDSLEDRILVCTQAIRSGVLSNELLVATLNNRGLLYFSIGDYEHAINDYDRALRLQPHIAAVLNNRGNAFGRKGDFYRAIEDLNEALRLAPDEETIYLNRGYVLFFLGRFDDSAVDLKHVIASNPTNLDAILWLTLAQERAGKAGFAELVGRVQNLNLDNWPGSAIRLYLGQMDPKEFTAAVNMASAHRGIQLCEAAFYIGELQLLLGHSATARKSLSNALDLCHPSFAAYQGAKSELARLD